MKLITSLEQIKTPFKDAVITIGNFDGVHLGHQALLHEVVERADEIGGTAIAMTFDPHPMRVLKSNGHPPLITLNEQKIELIESAGLDVLICIPFTLKFATITAHDYVKDLLLNRIGAKVIVVGKDYTFGSQRQGDVALLEKYSKQMGFELVVADWIQDAKSRSHRISSTRVRKLVQAGEMEAARKMLGRHYQIRGLVAHGRDRGGKLLGCPTANINLQDELAPKTGVYAVTVECLGQKFKGVANIGWSPTFDDHQFTVEVHLLDFDQDLYGRRIRVNFIHRMREEIKFNSIEELSAQIKKDIADAREILRNL